MHLFGDGKLLAADRVSYFLTFNMFSKIFLQVSVVKIIFLIIFSFENAIFYMKGFVLSISIEIWHNVAMFHIIMTSLTGHN